MIQNSATIVTQSTVIMQESVGSCSSTEVTSIQSHITILTNVLVTITSLITQYQKESVKDQFQRLMYIFCRF